jgi:hypothetical protein
LSLLGEVNQFSVLVNEEIYAVCLEVLVSKGMFDKELLFKKRQGVSHLMHSNAVFSAYGIKDMGFYNIDKGKSRRVPFTGFR